MKNISQVICRPGPYFVGAYLFSVPVFAYSESSGLLIIPQIAGALLIAYAVLDVFRTWRIKISGEVQLYGLFGLWAVLTFPLGVSTSQLWSLIGQAKVVAATLACAQLIKDDRDLLAALKIFVFSIFVIYYLNRYDLRYLSIANKISEADRFAGTLANANKAAIYAVAVIWASVFLLIHSRRAFLLSALLIAAIGVSSIMIYFSGSNKGFIGIGLFVVLLTRLLYIRQRSSLTKRIIVILISAFLILLIGYFIYSSPFFFRMEQVFHGESDSAMGRYKVFWEALDVWLMNIRTFIMGVGYDNFRFYDVGQSYSHSTPVELLASNGLIGFILFMGFIFILLRKFIFLNRHAHDEKLKSIHFSILIFLFLFCLFMIGAVMHESREILPILGCLSAFGQYHLLALEQINANKSTLNH